MREYRVLRDILRRVSRRAAGESPYGPRQTVGHTSTAGLDVEIAAMPVSSETVSVMNADGSFRFVLGFSRLGGSDRLG